MTDSMSPLADVYSTSTMEHHHFNQTVTILQQVSICVLKNIPISQNVKHSTKAIAAIFYDCNEFKNN